MQYHTIFSHFSNVESKPERLEVGLEVEYTVFNRDKGGKVSAENVKLLRKVSFGFFQQLLGDKNIFRLKYIFF